MQLHSLYLQQANKTWENQFEINTDSFHWEKKLADPKKNWPICFIMMEHTTKMRIYILRIYQNEYILFSQHLRESVIFIWEFYFWTFTYVLETLRNLNYKHLTWNILWFFYSLESETKTKLCDHLQNIVVLFSSYCAILFLLIFDRSSREQIWNFTAAHLLRVLFFLKILFLLC